MRSIKNICLILALLCAPFLAPLAPAQQKQKAKAASQPALVQKLDRSKKPAAGPAPQIQLAKPQTFTLPNGMKVFVVTNKKLPRVAFNLVLDYKPILERPFTGYVAMAGDLIGTGTTTRSKDQLDEEVDFLGAFLATTSTGVFVSGLSRHSAKLIDLMADVVLHPSMKEEELAKLKKQQLSALASEKDNAEAISNIVTSKLLFGPNHPFGENDTEETIKKITLEKCKDFYETYYRPNIAYLAIVGDINFADAKALVEKHFATWQKATVPALDYPVPAAPATTLVAIVDRPTSVQTVINVAQVVDLKPNSPDVIKARLMNDMLGGGSSARLFNNLREKHGWTYGAYSSLTQNKTMGTFEAGASVRNAVTDSAVAELLAEMQKIGKAKVADDELRLSKNSVAGSFVMSLESPQTIANFALNTERNNLAPDFYSSYLKNVEAVTADQVLATAEQYVRPTTCYIIAVGNAAEIGEKLRRFGPISYFDEQGNPTLPPDATKPAPIGVSAGTVLAKYIDAIGGPKAIAKLQDYSLSYEGEVQDFPFELDILSKVGGKYKTTAKVNGNAMSGTVIDGKAAMQKQGGTQKKFEGDELKRELAQSIMFWEAAPEKAKITVTLLGIDKIGNAQAYKVKAMIAENEGWTDYFNTTNGFKIKTIRNSISTQGPITTTFTYADYKPVGGVLFPGKMTISLGPTNIDLSLTKQAANTGIKDKEFEVK